MKSTYKTGDALKAVWIFISQGEKDFCKIMLRCLLAVAVWVGRVIAKVLDFYAFPQAMDSLWQAIKPDTRSLTTLEEQEARRIFGDGISYWQVRIDECSLISWIGAKINRCSGMGVTTFHTINFNRKINTAADNSEMKWLIHELTHVAQMECVGSQYLIEAIYAQASAGYAYRLGAKKHLRDYNREQQASIVGDYYIAHRSGCSTAAYDPYIVELKAGKL